MRIFGWIGGGLSVLYNIPQIYHIYKQKSTNDISIMSLIVRLVSYSFYITHGILIQDPPILWMTSFSFLQVLILSYQYYLYKSVNDLLVTRREVIQDSDG